MRALIVGGAGFIGSHLVEHLMRSGMLVTVFDANHCYGEQGIASDQAWKLSYRREHLLDGAHMIHGDVCHKRQLRIAVKQSQPDCVLYLAALPLVAVAETKFEEAGNTMVRGLTNALEVVRASNCVRRFVYVSSSMVYGDFTTDPINENAKTEPLNLYGGLKLAGEVLTRSYLTRTGIENVIVRPSGVYGPTDVHGRVVHSFCERAINRDKIIVLNGTRTFIDFTWVEDLVDGLTRAATHPRAANQTFNMTFGAGRSLDDLVRIVTDLVPGAEVVRTRVTQPGRPRRGSMDISKARDLIGYQPVVDLETGVARYLDFLRTKNVIVRSSLAAEAATEPALQ